jgi:orotidine-5'-phosphate decarboxylase
VTTTDPVAPAGVRDRLALVLDLDDLDAAIDLATELQEWFGVVKVGLELFAAAGPEAVRRCRDLGFEVFCDLKLHDIPTQVGRAATVLGALGARYVNFHAAGGEAMLRAGVEGLAAGAARAGLPPAIPIAVTVLTSDADTRAFDARLAVARAAGCGGVVCSVHEIARVRELEPEWVTIVPGVRLVDGAHHDQVRTGTPDEVAAAGGDLLVVGRAVTAAPDRRAAARRVSELVAGGLHARRATGLS